MFENSKKYKVYKQGKLYGTELYKQFFADESEALTNAKNRAAMQGCCYVVDKFCVTDNEYWTIAIFAANGAQY